MEIVYLTLSYFLQSAIGESPGVLQEIEVHCFERGVTFNFFAEYIIMK